MMCEISKKDGLKNLHGLNIHIANKQKDHPKSSDERQHDRLARNRKERPGYCVSFYILEIKSAFFSY